MSEAIEKLRNIINYFEVHSKDFEVINKECDYLGTKFFKWRTTLQLLLLNEMKDHPLAPEIREIINENSFIPAYRDLLGVLKAMCEQESFEYTNLDDGPQIIDTQKSLFISHSTLDIDYVKEFINLLENIGVIGSDKIFCSSIAEYGIPIGDDIYTYLKTKFRNNMHFIAVLSDSYYKSAACLNEMGAAWVTSNNQTAILVPEFNYAKIDGAIDASKVWFKFTDEERLNIFKEIIIEEFSLPKMDENIWNRKKADFLKNISDISKRNNYRSLEHRIDIEKVFRTDETTITLWLRAINLTDKDIQYTCIEIELLDEYENKMSFSLDMNHCEIFKYIVMKIKE